jgi:hypothetical protein
MRVNGSLTNKALALSMAWAFLSAGASAQDLCGEPQPAREPRPTARRGALRRAQAALARLGSAGVEGRA